MKKLEQLGHELFKKNILDDVVVYIYVKEFHKRGSFFFVVDKPWGTWKDFFYIDIVS